MWLLIAFIIVPVIEIALFIQVGGFIGLGPTLLIVIGTAIAGTYLVRSQGRLALSQLQQSFGDLRDPTEPLVHGAMILFSGALLLTPGFFTDALGFALLIPAFRKMVFAAVKARVNVQSFGTPGQGNRPHENFRQDDVIEGEYVELNESDDTQKGSSGWTKH